MKISPNITAKPLNECANGELIINRWGDTASPAFISRLSNDKDIMVIDLIHDNNTGLADIYDTDTVISIAEKYEIRVDTSYCNMGKALKPSDKLFMTDKGLVINFNYSGRAVTYSIEEKTILIGARPQLCSFPKWSIFIDDELAFKFDATAK